MPSPFWATRLLSRSLVFVGLLTGCTPTYYQPSPYYSPTPATPSYPAAPGYPVSTTPMNSAAVPVAQNQGYPSIPATAAAPVPSTPTTLRSLPVSTPTGSPVPVSAAPSAAPAISPNPTPVPASAPAPGLIPAVAPSAIPAAAPAAAPVPASSPTPEPSIPALPSDLTSQWVPWPMPPRSNATASTQTTHQPHSRGRLRHLSLATRPGSHAERTSREEASLTTAAASAAVDSPIIQTSATVSADGSQIVDAPSSGSLHALRYRGGKTLPHLGYVNLYLGGEQGWSMSDIRQIDQSLAAAMTDTNLNNVIRQYFNNQPIGTSVYPSHPLIGHIPEKVSRGDIQHYIQHLHELGYLKKYDTKTTVFNFICPRGTILTDHDLRTEETAAVTPHPLTAAKQHDANSTEGIFTLSESEASFDSITGLAGYHGSVHFGEETIYYSAVVYSESRQDGFRNGIAAFPEGWKNTVAMMYHELQEARTNPDVEDIIRNPTEPGIVRRLGWTSDAGEEIGDSPLWDNVSLGQVIQDVPLADGSGTVPVQFPYSNAAQGPEGPISQLHAPAVP